MRDKSPFLLLALATIVTINLSATPVSAQLFGAKKDKPEAKGVESPSAPQSFADLAEKLTPTVVNISSTQKATEQQQIPELPQFPPGSPFEDFFEDFLQKRDGLNIPTIPPASLGSGFIIDSENGYIITNNHVIREAEEVRVTFHDDTTLPAEVIGIDDKTDIAVLKVDTKKKLHAATFGDSDEMRVGDWVVAIGNPFGLGGTVTAGIVSARQRDINAGPYDDFIQTDASINRGNSGGPMFNVKGEIIGINTAIFSPSGGSVGIGFAIPSALAKPVIDQIIEYGRTRRGWLGVRIQTVTEEIAESLGLDQAEGALIASVNQEGPAKDAGLKAGDVILTFNGQRVYEMKELPRIVAETKIGTKTEVEFWRDGSKHTVDVKVGELEKAEEDGLLETSDLSESGTISEESIEDFGFAVSSLNDILRAQFNVPDNVSGVLITDVSNNSKAAIEGMLPGDVIGEIQHTPVKTPADVKGRLSQAKEENPTKPVMFLLNREGNVRFVALRFPEDTEESAKDTENKE